MTEIDVNRIIGNSCDWRYKIPDAGHGLKPFDGIALFKGNAIYWEAKLLKEVKAFNFTRLEDHQIANLQQVAAQNTPNILPLFLVVVAFGRLDKRLYIFRDMQYIGERKLQKRSILKGEWEHRRNYVPVVKSLISFEELLALPKEWEYEE
jgi:penicillin-binding protein-related factor A (putative recombinase)